MEQSILFPLHESISKKKLDLHQFTLKNGLTVILLQDTSKPKVLLQVAYDVGSAAETSEERGLAHLVEHMIFKGTKNLSEVDIDEISRKFGAEYNAFTSQDITAYYFEVEKNSWTHFLDILSECMFFSKFEQEHLASELKAVVQELNLFADDIESKIAEKAVELTFPPNHPYHYPVIGFKNTLANCSVTNLISFYEKHYKPENATLILIGDFDPEKTKDLIIEKFEREKTYNNTKNVNNSKNTCNLVPPNLLSLDFSLFEEIEQEKITFFWPLPGLIKSIGATSDIFSEIFGGGISGRLYKRFVDQEEIAKAVSLQVDLLHHAGMLFITVLPHDLNDSEKIKLILLDEFNKILTDGFSEQELDRAKKSLALVFIRNTENWQNMANGFVTDFFLKKNPETFFDYLTELDSISNIELKKFVKSFFNPDFIALIKLKKSTPEMRTILIKNRDIIKKEESLILENHQRNTPLDEPRFVNNLPAPSFLNFDFPKPTDVASTTQNIQIIFYEKKAYPITFCKILFKNTLILSKSKEGLLVDLMMQCIVEQSKKYSKRENLDFLNDLGAHATFDADGICLTTLTNNFIPALDRILYMFSEPMFTEETLLKHKKILLADLDEQKEDSQKQGVKEFYKNFYPKTDFDWSFNQAINFIKKITIKDLEQAHKKYFNPNAILAAFSGSFAKEQITNLVEKYFQKNSSGKFEIVYPKATPPKKLLLNLPMLKDQTTLLLVKNNEITIEEKDYLSIAILNIVLFYSLGSRVYKIRERRGAFYSLFGGFALDVSRFGSIDYICTTLNPNDAKKTKQEILEEIDLVRKNGITEQEFFAARQLYLSNLIGLISDVTSVTQVLLNLAQQNLSFDYYDKILDRLEKLTLEEINIVAKKRLTTDDFGIIFVGNIEKEKTNSF